MKTFFLLIMASSFCFSQQDAELNCDNLSLAQNDTIICKGDSVLLSVPNGYNYIWSNGDTSSSIIVYPTETMVFSVQISSSPIDSIVNFPICDASNSLLGDVSEDGIINVQDIVLIIDWILGGVYNSCGDVNCDGILDEEDVTIIQNFILGFGDIVGCINCFDEVLVTVETCGCTDPLACNYCNTCSMDDDSCWYLEDCDEVLIKEHVINKILYAKFDLLGRAVNNVGINIEIYNNGSIIRKQVLK